MHNLCTRFFYPTFIIKLKPNYYGLVHEKQMVDMGRNGRLPRLSHFCEYLLHAGVSDTTNLIPFRMSFLLVFVDFLYSTHRQNH